MPVKEHRPPRLNVEIPEDIQIRLNNIFTEYGERTVVINEVIRCLVETLETVPKEAVIPALLKRKLCIVFEERNDAAV
jgi:hypothetical protein